MMTTPINPFIPVTPPPENQTFSQKPVPLQRPQPRMGGLETPLSTPSDFTGHRPQSPRRLQGEKQRPQAQAQCKRDPSQMQPPPRPTPRAPHLFSQQSQSQVQPQQQPLADFSMDKELVMATRIAAFYQQRCQTITNLQQQSCQAWANTYRQKCDETMQAAMLVVAWYVRDRIRKRRRKQKDKFRRGLREMRMHPKPIAREERVRGWVTQVPDEALPPNAVPMDRVIDKEEATFSLDAEIPPDKDTKLFEMADNLIKSQHRNIEVPLMGVLSFDESDSDSEDGSLDECPRCSGRSEIEVMGDPPDTLDLDEEFNGGEVYEEEENELYENEDTDEADEEELGSKLVHGEKSQGSRDNDESLPLR